jgi:hypothetical protein
MAIATLRGTAVVAFLFQPNNRHASRHRITQPLPRRPDRSLSVPLAPPPPLGRLPIATLAAS